MWRLAARYSTVGIEISAAVAIGTLGGWWLDTQLDTEPVLFWIGLVVGVGAATKTIYRVVASTKLGDL